MSNCWIYGYLFNFGYSNIFKYLRIFKIFLIILDININLMNIFKIYNFDLNIFRYWFGLYLVSVLPYQIMDVFRILLDLIIFGKIKICIEGGQVGLPGFLGLAFYTQHQWYLHSTVLRRHGGNMPIQCVFFTSCSDAGRFPIVF